MNKTKTLVLMVMLVLMATSMGWAAQKDKAGSQDHPLFSRIPGFHIAGYLDVEFDQVKFETAKGKQVVEGRKVEIIYRQEKGEKAMSMTQKIQNYTKAIKKIGGEVLKESTDYATMKVEKGEREIYVRISSPYRSGKYFLVIVEKEEMRQDVVAHAKALDGAEKKAKAVITDRKEDIPGSKDHPLISRIPDYYIASYKEIEFGQQIIETAKGKVTVEGRKFEIMYRQQKGAPTMSGIQKIRNYTNAIEKIGGEVLKSTSHYATMKAVVDKTEVWLRVSSPYRSVKYFLTIVEKGAMEQEVTADADAMLEDIQKTGHVAVYGIHFDTGKATLKASSAPALKEITRLLKKKPKLNIYVVGHTDMVGTLINNIALANNRAKAVVKELTGKYKIRTKRLTPKGVGPLSPLDSNRSKDGKAKNRRVDLVEKI